MGVFTGGNEELAKPQSYRTPRGITAAGTTIKATDVNEVTRLAQRKKNHGWQQEAWEYFDLIPEIHYAFTTYSNIMSRVRLVAAVVENDQDNPTPVEKSDLDEDLKKDINKAMMRVFGANRQSTLLRTSALNFLVAGECYLVNEYRTVHGRQVENWRIASVDHLVNLDKGFGLKDSSSAGKDDITPLRSDAFIGRMWREHPRFPADPDSSMKSLCDVCDDLLLLDRAVRTSARTRLNNGIFYLPEELSVSADAPTDQYSDDELSEYVESNEDELEESLIDSFSAPVNDFNSMASVAPLILRGPAEYADKIKHFKFDRSFDPALALRADRALERILQGIDLPKEFVSGLSSVKYANAIVITDSMYTTHIEPMIIMLCDIFRTIYLEPALFALGYDAEDIAKVVIWYDPSGITTAPDRSSAANVGHDKMVLSGEAWRRANGFTEDDAPTAEEVAERIAITRGQLTPETTNLLFTKLFPEIMAATRQQAVQNSVAPIPNAIEELINPGAAPAAPVDPTTNIPGNAPKAPPKTPPAPTQSAGGGDGDYTPVEDLT